jgi:hypothetical protein
MLVAEAKQGQLSLRPSSTTSPDCRTWPEPYARPLRGLRRRGFNRRPNTSGAREPELARLEQDCDRIRREMRDHPDALSAPRVDGGRVGEPQSLSSSTAIERRSFRSTFRSRRSPGSSIARWAQPWSTQTVDSCSRASSCSSVFPRLIGNRSIDYERASFVVDELIAGTRSQVVM